MSRYPYEPKVSVDGEAISRVSSDPFEQPTSKASKERDAVWIIYAEAKNKEEAALEEAGRARRTAEWREQEAVRAQKEAKKAWRALIKHLGAVDPNEVCEGVHES